MGAVIGIGKGVFILAFFGARVFESVFDGVYFGALVVDSFSFSFVDQIFDDF